MDQSFPSVFARHERTRPSCRRHTKLAGVALLALALPTLVQVPDATDAAAQPVESSEWRARQDQPPPLLRAPVDAPIVERFHLPTQRWEPGNRGIDYGTEPGNIVHAAGDGEVFFAGSVGHTRHVTVLHPSGLRSTVSFLAQVDVVIGQQVRAGQRLGVAGGPLHFGVRAGDEYLDPEALLGGALPPARLVLHDPFDGDSAASRRARQAFEREVLAMVRGPGLFDVLLWLLPDPGVVIDFFEAVSPHVATQRLAWAMHRWHVSQRHCTPADVVPAKPTARRVAVLVAGLGSSATTAGIDGLDTAALGYAPGDVVRFSYRGGRVPGTAALELEGVPVRDYHSIDTQGDLREAARLLLELLQEIALAAPGVPIDVYAHSQGGVVARLALGEGSLPGQVEVLVTFATPHQGADHATTLALARGTPGLGHIIDGVHSVAGVGPTAVALEQLSEGSALMKSLPAPPSHLAVLSIAARGDLLVSAPSAVITGHRSAIVSASGPDAHQQVVSAPASAREVELLLAGLPPSCESGLDAFMDAVVSDTIDRFANVLPGTIEVFRRVLSPLRLSRRGGSAAG